MPVDRILDEIVYPLTRLVEEGTVWLTLSEVIGKTKRNRKYFTRQGQDGLNRLNRWRNLGLARRTEDGWWLLSGSVLGECGVGEPDDDRTWADGVLEDLNDGA